MHPLLYFGPFLALSAASIYARARNSNAYYYLKAFPLFWIIACYVLTYDPFAQPNAERTLILAGLVLGVYGDLFLAAKPLFPAGFVCFLAGHAAYLAAFLAAAGLPPLWAGPLFLIPGLIFSVVLSRRTEKASARAIVWSYSALLSAMTVGAAYRDLSLGAAPWMTVGALLFAISDGFWSWNRFVRPLASAPFAILCNYYLGQALIGWAALRTLAA